MFNPRLLAMTAVSKDALRSIKSKPTGKRGNLIANLQPQGIKISLVTDL